MRSAALVAIPSLVLSIIAWPAISPVTAEPKSQLLTNATVKRVSASSLTVSAKGNDITFEVDAKTRVIQKGIRPMPLPPADGPSFTRLLKQGDQVTITYQETRAMTYASKIEVTSTRAAR